MSRLGYGEMRKGHLDCMAVSSGKLNVWMSPAHNALTPLLPARTGIVTPLQLTWALPVARVHPALKAPLLRASTGRVFEATREVLRRVRCRRLRREACSLLQIRLHVHILIINTQ